VEGGAATRPSADGSNSSSSNGGGKNGSSICFSWHDTLSSVPTHDAVTGRPIPTFVICQELVDELPVHSFQKVEGMCGERGWLTSPSAMTRRHRRPAVICRYANADAADTPGAVDASPVSSLSNDNAPSPPPPPGGVAKKIPQLRFILPPDTTPALRSLLRIDGRGSPLRDNPSAHSLDSLPVGSIIEACPKGLLLVQDIADWIERCRGGAALIVDYGGDGSSGGDTLR